MWHLCSFQMINYQDLTGDESQAWRPGGHPRSPRNQLGWALAPGGSTVGVPPQGGAGGWGVLRSTELQGRCGPGGTAVTAPHRPTLSHAAHRDMSCVAVQTPL